MIKKTPLPSHGSLAASHSWMWSLFIALLAMICPVNAHAQDSTFLTGLAGKCLDVTGGSSNDGTPVILYPCHGGPNQQWRLLADNTVRGLAGKCLDVTGGSSNDGTPVILYPCHGGPNQQWHLLADNTIRGLAGKCLDVTGGSSNDGTPVILYPCHGGPNQQWKKSVVEQAQPPAETRRPNFVTIIMDDAGFSDVGLYGAEIATPNIDEFAKVGITFTNFYAASACMITRAMFYTGKDYHNVGMGNVLGWNDRPEQKGQPGYEGYLLKSALPFPELLQSNGYHTMMTGKWDMGNTPELDAHSRGFTETRALLLPSGDTHFSEKDGTMISTRPRPPEILYSENGKKLEKFPREFYSTTYYTDVAIEMLDRRDKSKPFYLNVAHISPHTPWQAPAEVTAKYLARYAKGWDGLRQERFKRQQELGLFPKETQLPPRPADVLAWDSLSADEQKVETKKMAIYAAMIDILDQNVGRLVSHLKQIGEYENTVIFFFSDNGAAYGLEAKAIPPRWKYITEKFDNSYDNLGNRNSYEGAHIGWALLSNTPFNNYKGDLYEGGVHLPALVRYPRSTVAGVSTNRILSVMDIAPTILEMAGIAYPKTYNGQPNKSMNGESMADLFTGNVAYNPDRVLAWELNGAMGVRQGDWKISQRWLESTQCWESPGLFNLAADPFERDDLAQKEPRQFTELLALYERFAKENNVMKVSSCMPK